MQHRNAPLTPLGRRRLVALVEEDGLTLSAECEASGAMQFTATTSVAHAEIYASGNYQESFDGELNQEFEPGETAPVGSWMGDHSQNEVQGQVVYSTLAGGVVTVQVSMNAFGHNGVGSGCSLQGTTESS